MAHEYSEDDQHARGGMGEEFSDGHSADDR
jgi:hypothetical protein